MALALRDSLLTMIGALRSEGVRISVAESLDAMRAVAAAGLERVPMREALRATLIKEEADNPTFDTIFARHFGAGARPAGDPHRGRGLRTGVSGTGRGEGGGSPLAKPDARSEPNAAMPGDKPRVAAEQTSHNGDLSRTDTEEAPVSTDRASRGDARTGAVDRPGALGERFEQLAESETGSAMGSHYRAGEIDRMPFAVYSQLDYERARNALVPIKRRFRVRLGRRLRTAARGRIDFRRTIRAGIQSGGAFADLRFRSRRPRRVELLVLADISGSVSYASTLMLEIAAGARELFHRFHCFVYIDRLAEADIEQGHLVMTPALDLYARSDFGRVLSQLLHERQTLLNRATVVVIMGDGRNNRRPARADLLREVARRCRAVIWLNPEPVSRWRTGDSAIANYEPELDALVLCDNLRMLEKALGLLH